MEKFTIFQRDEAGYPQNAETSAEPLPLFGKGALLDTVALPGHNRASRTILGLLVGNSKPGFGPASKHYFGFNLNFNDVPIGNANALHIHKTFEYFMAFTGDFAIDAGNGGKSSARLGKFDLIIVPPHIKRSFRCIAAKEDLHYCKEMAEDKDGKCALILAGIVGEPWVQWSAETVEQARKNGVNCTDAGLLIEDGQPAPVQDYVEEEDCSQEELEACIYHAEDRPKVTRKYGDGDMTFEYVDIPAGGSWKGDPSRNYVAFLLTGPAVETRRGDHSLAATLGPGEVMVFPKEVEWTLARSGAENTDTPSLVFLISANISPASYPPGALSILAAEEDFENHKNKK